ASAAHLRAPADLFERVGFDQNLGAQVPLDLRFRDAQGRTVRLGDYFDDRPVLLVLGYYRCPNLCGAVLDGVAQAVPGTRLGAGRQFEVIDVSIDPDEGPALAAAKQAGVARRYPQAGAMRWHFLTGSAAASSALAHAVGFRYYHDARNDQYAHAAGIVVLTPDGQVARYLFGVQFPPQSLRFGLIEASSGRIGSLIDRLVLLCCDYDPSTGRYSLLIGRILAAACLATVLVLIGLVLGLQRRARARSGARP
ncbi:MAG TPA: SCO family protein, partial [Rhodanobacteraceae bacterium]|nr:SCO family protein [Rhodanobacteraceae bacterium]